MRPRRASMRSIPPHAHRVPESRSPPPEEETHPVRENQIMRREG
jgi:hypothetical protein